MQKTILIVTLIGFSILTGVALYDHGYFGILLPHFQTFGGAQVLVDLIIALSLFLVWMWQDAKTLGRNPYLWLALTLVTGSIGQLIYLITRKNQSQSTTK